MDEEDTHDTDDTEWKINLTTLFILHKFRTEKNTASGMVLSSSWSFLCSWVHLYLWKKQNYLFEKASWPDALVYKLCLYVQMASSITRNNSNCIVRAFHVLFTYISSLPITSWNDYFWGWNLISKKTGKECIHETSPGSTDVDVVVSVHHCTPRNLSHISETFLMLHF